MPLEYLNATSIDLQVRRKTSGGTVDEENFISQFSVTAGVPVILSTKMLDQEMAGVHTRLTALDWSLKVTGFQCLRGIIMASTSYTDHLLERLKLLETGISDSLRDTRSAVVREAAVTIAFIAQQHQYKVRSQQPCAEYFATLFTVIKWKPGNIMSLVVN